MPGTIAVVLGALATAGAIAAVVGDQMASGASASSRSRSRRRARRRGASRCIGSALLDGERVAAAARRGGVRVVDLEPGLLEAVQEVDRRALEVRSAVGVDHDRDAVLLERLVVVDRAGVEAEPVLEARAPAALDRDAQNRALALGILGHQLADLLRGVRGQGNESVGALDDLHTMMVAGAKVVPRRVTL